MLVQISNFKVVRLKNKGYELSFLPHTEEIGDLDKFMFKVSKSGVELNYWAQNAIRARYLICLKDTQLIKALKAQRFLRVSEIGFTGAGFMTVAINEAYYRKVMSST